MPHDTLWNLCQSLQGLCRSRSACVPDSVTCALCYYCQLQSILLASGYFEGEKYMFQGSPPPLWRWWGQVGSVAYEPPALFDKQCRWLCGNSVCVFDRCMLLSGWILCLQLLHQYVGRCVHMPCSSGTLTPLTKGMAAAQPACSADSVREEAWRMEELFSADCTLAWKACQVSTVTFIKITV